MYKGNSDNAQRRASKIHLRDLPSGIKVTPEMEHEALKARLEQLYIENKKEMSALDKKRLGLQIHDLQKRISEVRKNKKDYKNMDRNAFAHHFVDLAKEYLPKHQFKFLIDKSYERTVQNESKPNDPETKSD